MSSLSETFTSAIVYVPLFLMFFSSWNVRLVRLITIAFKLELELMVVRVELEFMVVRVEVELEVELEVEVVLRDEIDKSMDVNKSRSVVVNIIE